MRKIISTFVAGVLVSTFAMAQTSTTPETMEPAVTSLPVTQSNHDALSEADIKHRIAEAGYKEVKGLEFEDGVWHTEARGGNDHWVDLRIGPVNGKVYEADAPSQLNKDEIRAKLSAAGYGNIHDVEFDHGLWSADATNASGVRLDLLVDPDDGSVVASERD